MLLNWEWKILQTLPEVFVTVQLLNHFRHCHMTVWCHDAENRDDLMLRLLHWGKTENVAFSIVWDDRGRSQCLNSWRSALKSLKGSTSECEEGERKKEVMKWKGNDEVKHIMRVLWGPADVELLCCKCVSRGWLNCRMMQSFFIDLGLKFCLGLRIWWWRGDSDMPWGRRLIRCQTDCLKPQRIMAWLWSRSRWEWLLNHIIIIIIMNDDWMCHHISWWGLGIHRHRWMVHHILLILNLLILNLLILQSQRDVGGFLSNPFWFLQMVLNMILLMLSLLLQSLFPGYVILTDRIIEEGNQTDSGGGEWKVGGDSSVQHQRINHICDLQVLIGGEGKSPGPCTADQGQINALQAGELMQLNNMQQASLGLSLNLDQSISMHHYCAGEDWAITGDLVSCTTAKWTVQACWIMRNNCCSN